VCERVCVCVCECVRYWPSSCCVLASVDTHTHTLSYKSHYPSEQNPFVRQNERFPTKSFVVSFDDVGSLMTLSSDDTLTTT